MSVPEPAAEGDLATTPFAHLLVHLMTKGLTGSLVVWNPEGEVGRQQDRIFFERGRLRSGRLLASASRLDRGLLPLFARQEGPFAFYADVDLVGESEHVRTGAVPIPALIAASLRGPSRDDVVQRVVADLGDFRLRFVAGADLERLALLPEERQCVELLRADPVSAPQLAELSALDDRRVVRLVYLLTIHKLIEPWDGVARTVAPPPSDSAQREPERTASPRRGGPEPPPPAPSHLSEDHQNRWEEIRHRAIAIENETYFEMLGVPHDAAQKAVESAYYGLVKKWHPDRIPAELVALRPVLERIFQYLTRAQEDLCDMDRRGLYLQTVQAGGGTPESERRLGEILEAAMDFQKVEIMMRRHEYAEAMELIDRIIQLSPEEGLYYATRAEIRWKDGGEANRDATLKDLDIALELSDNLDSAHYLKGMILKKAGDDGGAYKHFKRASELNGRNIAAAREVRLAQMRGTTKSKSAAKDSKRPAGRGKGKGRKGKGRKREEPKDGLFGKLFKSGKK